VLTIPKEDEGPFNEDAEISEEKPLVKVITK
jgi:hypothetical protein